MHIVYLNHVDGFHGAIHPLKHASVSDLGLTCSERATATATNKVVYLFHILSELALLDARFWPGCG